MAAYVLNKYFAFSIRRHSGPSCGRSLEIKTVEIAIYLARAMKQDFDLRKLFRNGNQVLVNFSFEI